MIHIVLIYVPSKNRLKINIFKGPTRVLCAVHIGPPIPRIPGELSSRTSGSVLTRSLSYLFFRQLRSVEGYKAECLDERLQLWPVSSQNPCCSIRLLHQSEGSFFFRPVSAFILALYFMNASGTSDFRFSRWISQKLEKSSLNVTKNLAPLGVHIWMGPHTSEWTISPTCVPLVRVDKKDARDIFPRRHPRQWVERWSLSLKRASPATLPNVAILRTVLWLSVVL
jgi:hypothetical protein